MKTTRNATTNLTVSEADARERFFDLARQVAETGEAVIVSRHDGPDVVVIPSEEYRRNRYASDVANDWWASMAQTHELIRRELAGRPPIPWEEIIRTTREESDEQSPDDLR